MHFDRNTPSSADQILCCFSCCQFSPDVTITSPCLRTWSQFLRVFLPTLGISISKPYRKFKSPLISLMTEGNGGTNYFLCANLLPAKVVEPNIAKIKGHTFTGVYLSPVLMKLDARKCTIL